MKLSKHLIRYSKNDSLLLINGGAVKPVYFPYGKEVVTALLKEPDKLLETDHNLLNFLASHNIIVDDHDIEEFRPKGIKQRISYGDNHKFDTKNTLKTTGASLYLLLTQSCNLACVYCLNGEQTYQKSKHLMMKEAVAFKGIDKICERIAPGGRLEIVFFGGEPLLNWKLAKKIILFCENTIKKRYNLNIKYHLTSNLTLFPSDLIEWAKKYQFTFLCDIDGKEQVHNLSRPYKNSKGSFFQTARNIEKITNAGLGVALRATVTSINMNHILETSRCHKELGGIGSAFVPVNAVNSDETILNKFLLPDPDIVARGLIELIESNLWEKENIFPLNEFLRRIKPHERNIWSCGAPHGNTPVLDVNGTVYPCIYLVGINRYCLGNILNKNSYPETSVLEMMKDIIDIDNTKKCRNCKYRYICGGGCPVGRLLVDGNPQADQDIINYTHQMACKINKIMIKESLWHYAVKRQKQIDNFTSFGH